MMLNRLSVLLISFSFALTGLGQGLVSMPNIRADLLVGVDEILGREPIDLSLVETSRPSPFLVVTAEPAPVVQEQTRREEPVAAAPVPRLSDQAALRMAARSFQPAGSLITSSRRVLRLDNGRMVNEGHVFAVTIRGERYRVIIDSVSEDGYVLRIGDAVVSRSFTESDDRARRVNTTSQ